VLLKPLKLYYLSHQTYSLRPVKLSNTRILRITATAGTKFVDAYYLSLISLFSLKKEYFKKQFLSSFRWFRWIKLTLIVQYSSLLPPNGTRVFSHSRCGCTSYQDQLSIIGLLVFYTSNYLKLYKLSYYILI